MVRENIDARKKTVKYVLTYEVFVGDTSKSENTKKAERNYLYVEPYISQIKEKELKMENDFQQLLLSVQVNSLNH